MTSSDKPAQEIAKSYADAGVNIRLGEALVERIKETNPGIGGFAGLFKLDEKRSLVGCTDGVGTKLELGIAVKRYAGLGQDLVAMSVNDLVVCGARPLFFLDYFATGKLDVDVAHAVIEGIRLACSASGCVLLGGETAEMPGFYDGGKFDLAGFAVGIVDNDKIVDGSQLKPGDVIVGLPSTGFHSNGYSLVRSILKKQGKSLETPYEHRGRKATLGEALTEPTALYAKEVLGLLEEIPVKGMAHITGGGLTNLQRVLPRGLSYHVDKAAIPTPMLFRDFQAWGEVPEEDAWAVWNMGMGFAVMVDPTHAASVLRRLPSAFIAGKITEAG